MLSSSHINISSEFTSPLEVSSLSLRLRTVQQSACSGNRALRNFRRELLRCTNASYPAPSCHCDCSEIDGNVADAVTMYRIGINICYKTESRVSLPSAL